MPFKSISEAAEALRSRRISCVELVDESLRQTEGDRPLNAWITLTDEAARARAGVLDRELAEGKDRGPLHGIPIGLKDLFFTRGVRTTNGSRIYADHVPDTDATVVERLDAAGAISIGKLNMHECAYGITSTNPHFGAVRNPHSPEHIPGGSSGGSGVAVATGAVFCGMGSDTGGSVRIPASFCGVVGLKPTYGRVSRNGCFPLGLTLDHMGPLTRTVRDAGLILNAIAGADERDADSVQRAWEDFDVSPGFPARIGVPVNFYNESVQPDVASAFARVVASIGKVSEVTVPDPAALTAAARTVLMAEATAVYHRYLDRRDDFGSDVYAILDFGRKVTGPEYVEAQRVRQALTREWMKLFDDIDVLLTPATPIPAPAIGQKTVATDTGDEDVRLLSTKFVRGINALGFPAISIPCGTSGNLPLGLQIIARPWGERMLLACAAALRGE